jgi:hypothetical protein
MVARNKPFWRQSLAFGSPQVGKYVKAENLGLRKVSDVGICSDPLWISWRRIPVNSGKPSGARVSIFWFPVSVDSFRTTWSLAGQLTGELRLANLSTDCGMPNAGARTQVPPLKPKPFRQTLHPQSKV